MFLTLLDPESLKLPSNKPWRSQLLHSATLSLSFFISKTVMSILHLKGVEKSDKKVNEQTVDTIKLQGKKCTLLLFVRLLFSIQTQIPRISRILESFIKIQKRER